MVWHTKGGHLSAAHKAKISASLKRRGGNSLAPARRRAATATKNRLNAKGGYFKSANYGKSQAGARKRAARMPSTPASHASRAVGKSMKVRDLKAAGKYTGGRTQASKNAQPSSRFRRTVVSGSAPAMANRPTKSSSTQHRIKRAGAH